MIFVNGAARVRADVMTMCQSFAQFLPGRFKSWFPIEDFVAELGPFSYFPRCLQRLGPTEVGDSGVILCGHSFGVLVSQVLAEYFEKSGCYIRGLVALDCRTKPSDAFLPIAPIPPRLSEFVAGGQLSFRAFRCLADMCCMAPLVPGTLPSRAFH